MPRILYVLVSEGAATGGHKMILRHVETLRELGFDAWCYLSKEMPTGIEHSAPIERGGIRDDDVVVVPDDASHQLELCMKGNWRSVVFAQGTYLFAALGYDLYDRFPANRRPTIMTVAERAAATIRRAYPEAHVEVVRCFADERRFQPAAEKIAAVAFTPRKRQLEVRAISRFFLRFHPRHSGLQWVPIENRSEAEVARGFGRCSLFLSLSRLEAVGITPLEAMASGAICAGFTGVGGAAFATPENGFWVPEDDCEAAADALAEAADLVAAGGASLKAMREAGFETARAWSYAAFRRELEEVWMRLAPQARVSTGPLAVGG